MRTHNPLHRARIQKGLNLARIATITCLSPRIVQQLDEGRFAELPGGLYARSYVRTFASAVGLDPDTVIEELADRLPPAGDPLSLMRANAERDTPAWVRRLQVTLSRISGFLGVTEGPRVTDGPRRTDEADAARSLTWRWAPAAADAALVLALPAALLALAAWTADAPIALVLEKGWPGVAGACAPLAVLYFALLSRSASPPRRRVVLRLPAAAVLLEEFRRAEFLHFRHSS